MYEYENLIFLLRIITNIAIPLLCIFVYKTWKEKKLLFFAFLFTVELIIIQINIYDFNNSIKYINKIFYILILIKILLLLILQKNDRSGFIKYSLSTLLACILLFIPFATTALGNRVYEIIINLLIISAICMNNINKKYIKNELNKNKLSMNKEYISKIIDDIEKESMINNYMKEDVKTANDKLHSIVEVINMPIIILKVKNLQCIFKNKYFDEFLKDINYDSENFNTKDFIKTKLKKNPEDLYKEVITMDCSEENYIPYSFSNKKYKLVMVKDYLNDEEIIICEIKDITEASLEEDELKRSELRYKTLMDILSDGVIIHDGTNVNYINKIAMDIFGLESSTQNVLSIEKILKRISQDSQDEFRHNLFVLEQNLRVKERSQLQLENGKIIDFISSTFTLNNKKLFLSIINDCTKHEVALNKLEENKKTYSTLLQTLPEGIILVNRYTKKQVYANKYMMRLLKDIGIDKFNKIIDSYIEDKDEFNFRTFYINPDKNKKISIAIKQVPKQNNLLIIVRDLEVEQQAERVYNNLQIIKERNRYKTEFLNRASSNLKKPINTIFEVNKFLDSKKDVYNYDGMKSYIKTVKKNSYRLKRLLNNIEEISKIEEGVYFRDYKTYDLVKYLQSLVNLCSEYTKKKELDIKFESNKREVLVYMDKDKIEKIILNILSNAIKFTEKGGEITVSLIVDRKDIVIAIIDNGSGIPSNKLDFIFENFEQVNRSLSRTAEGTGVGLYLVKKLTQIHHARIKVNSKIGYGSKFEIILKDNFLENTKENRNKVEKILIDKEDIDLEFSDIYLS